MSEASQAIESKLLSDLRVVDLRNALESRDLEKTGVKATLLDRLKEALLIEGLDPDTYRFDVTTAAGDRKSSGKNKSGTEESDTSLQENDEMEESDNPNESVKKVETTAKAKEAVAEDPGKTAVVEAAEAEGQTKEPAAAKAESPPPAAPQDAVTAAATPAEQEAAASRQTGAADLPPPPDPEDVAPQCTFTVDETVRMHAAAHPPGRSAATAAETDSLYVNVDDTASEASAVVGGPAAAPTAAPAVDGATKEPSKTKNSAKEQMDVDAAGGDAQKQAASGDTLVASNGDTPAPAAAPNAQEERQSAGGETAPPPTVVTCAGEVDIELHLSPNESAELASPDDENSVEMKKNPEEEEASLGADKSDVKNEVELSEAKAENGHSEVKPEDEKLSPAEHKAKKVAAQSNPKHLWISGLASATRAADLKALFSQYGRVVSAKIMTSTKAPSSKCFGFVAMGAPDEASKCIQHLHRTELKGKMISVERTKSDMFPASANGKTTAGKKSTAVKNGSAAVKSPAGERAKSEVSSSDVRRRDRVRPSRRDDADASRRRPLIARSSRETAGHGTSERRLIRPPTSSRYHTVSTSYRGGSRGGGYYRGGLVVNSRGVHRIAPAATSRGGAMFVTDVRRPTTTYGLVADGAPLMAAYTTGGGYDGANYYNKRYRGDDNARMVNPEPFDRRELEREMRRKEEEFQQREERLKLEKEREKLKAEREKIEREKLEIQQVRLNQQLLAQQQQMAAAGYTNGAVANTGSYGSASSYAMPQSGGGSDHRRGGGYVSGGGSTTASYGQQSRQTRQTSGQTATDDRRGVVGGSTRSSARDSRVQTSRDDRRISSSSASRNGASSDTAYHRRDAGSGGAHRRPAPSGDAPSSRAFDSSSSRYGGTSGLESKKSRLPDYSRGGDTASSYSSNRAGDGGSSLSRYSSSRATTNDDGRRGDVSGGRRSTAGGGLASSLVGHGGGYSTTAIGGGGGAASYQPYASSQLASTVGGYAGASAALTSSSTNMWQTLAGQQLASGGGTSGSWGSLQSGYGGGASTTGVGATADRFDAYKYSGGVGASRRY